MNRPLGSIFQPHRHRGVSALEDDRNNPDLADIIERNIVTLVEMRRRQEEERSTQERAADGITAFSGSMLFVYLHAAVFIGWIVVNLGHTPIRPFDPFPFNLLTMVVSLEAIFLSTFVLISQNRMAAVSDKRADLDLQINLLAEHEITRILKRVDSIAEHLGLTDCDDAEDEELEKDVAPEAVLREMEQRARERRRQ